MGSAEYSRKVAKRKVIVSSRHFDAHAPEHSGAARSINAMVTTDPRASWRAAVPGHFGVRTVA